MNETQVADIALLFAAYGAQAYDGARRESVSALAHALQCAQLAEWAHADPPLVAAALLHDIGHFIAIRPKSNDADDLHETRGAWYLQQRFGAAVVEPVRLHVEAKRYLVATDRGYAATLSPASIYSLGLQGGPMSRAEARAFESVPHAQQAVQLRRWDDAAKEPGKATPSLGYYLALLGELVLDAPSRTARERSHTAA